MNIIWFIFIVSGIYAESEKHRVCFNGHLWTKSKFLGLSIGVHNVGNGVLYLLDRDEEYILTFPSGYGRNILAVPWFEFGGTCKIHCPQTGIYCNVEFHTKVLLKKWDYIFSHFMEVKNIR